MPFTVLFTPVVSLLWQVKVRKSPAALHLSVPPPTVLSNAILLSPTFPPNIHWMKDENEAVLPRPYKVTA